MSSSPSAASRAASARPKLPVPPRIATFTRAHRRRRTAAAARRRAALASLISVCVTTGCEPGHRRRPAHRPRRSTSASIEPVVTGRDVRRRRAAGEPREHPVGRPLHGAAADQRADRDARDAAPLERRADLVDREDRADRDVRVARRDQDQVGACERLEHARRRPRLGRAGVVDGVDLVAVAARDEPGLERERPGGRLDERPHAARRSRAAAPARGRGRARSARSPPRAARPRAAARVRTRCSPMSRSPSRNHASPPSAATVSSACQVSPARPQPRSSSARPVSV